MKNKNKPSIRFPEFNQAWEQRKLGDITNYIKGFAFKSTDYKKNGVRIIRVSDLSKDNIKDTDDNTFIDFDNYHSYKKYSINPEDIIITTVGSKAEMKNSAVGRPIIIKSTENYLLNQNLVKINPKKEYVSYFIYYQLLQPKYSEYLAMIERGNANQANIAINDLWEYVLQVPSKEEQTKIGKFSEQLDDTIALHQQELSILKQTKQGFLQKMFPKEGESVPEVRFPGFTEVWKECNLENAVEFYSGLTYSPDNITEKGTLVLRSSNIQNGEIVDADNVYVNPKFVNSQNVEVGDVIVVVRNGSRNLIGKHASVKKKMENTVIGAFMTGIKAQIPSFINVLLDSNQFSVEINKNLGATINQITTGNFKEMKFFFPTNEEQEKIGNFFEKIDETIALYQQELEALQETKKSFLQKMFV